ncbi:MAG: tetratricopeptide repeat protein, partial [Bacteroidales bacterium]|nr:tetratricopeptide repeat protein [Bacteroidales bacterium]
AQIQEIDSLENLLRQHVQKDTIRVNLLNETAYKFYTINIDKTLKYAEEAEKLADKLSFAKGKAESLKLIGIYYYMKSDYPKALEYYKKALKIAEGLGDKSGISKCLNNIGVVYKFQGDYPKALGYYQKSLKIAEGLGDKSGISKCFNNIGVIYKYQGDYPKALEYCQKSLKIAEGLGDKSGISQFFNNVGVIYEYQGDYPKALEYYQKSLKMKEGLGDKNGISKSYGNIGNIYKNQGDYPKALEYFKKALKISIETGNKSIETGCYIELGLLYLKQKKTKEAHNYSKKAYIMAEEIGVAKFLKESSEILAKSSESLGLYKEAYKYYVVFKTMNDSLYNEERIKKIASLEYQYKYEKEKQVIELEQQKKDAVRAEEEKQQKTIKNLFIVGFILMALLVLVMLRGFLQKRKANLILSTQKEEIEKQNIEIQNQAEELETKNKKLKELNATKDKFFSIIAHDLKSPFNTLLGFSNLLLKKHKNFDEGQQEKYLKIIDDSLIKAYKLLENLLTWSQSQTGRIKFSPVKTNIKTLIDEIILLLTEATGNKNIKLLVNIENNLFVYADKNMIGTVIRNLISNAIKFTPKDGEISINARLTPGENEQNFTQISVKDNGVGIEKEIQTKLFNISKNTSTKGTEDEAGTGLGLILCKEFVEKHGGKIWVKSETGKGSSFFFTIPFKPINSDNNRKTR